jgi:hypothetical protein
MEGNKLFNYIEQQARIKYNKNEEWKLRKVDLIDNEIAKITLKKDKEKINGMVIYNATNI